jgi:hypothetical protein
MRRGRERDTGIRQQRYQEDMKKEQQQQRTKTEAHKRLELRSFVCKREKTQFENRLSKLKSWEVW